MSLALFWIYIYITGEIKKKINKNTKENKREKETICWLVLGVLPEKSCTRRGTSSLYTSCCLIATMPEGTLWSMSSLQHISAVSKLWKPKKSDSGGSDVSAYDDVDADSGDASDAADDAPVLDDVLCDDCVCGDAGVECAGVLCL